MEIIERQYKTTSSLNIPIDLLSAAAKYTFAAGVLKHQVYSASCRYNLSSIRSGVPYFTASTTSYNMQPTFIFSNFLT